MRLIGVDVGGTFTDLVYADTEAGETAVHKVSTTPGRSLARRRRGPDGALRQVRHPARDHRRGVPRHHHRHQRHPRARRRRHRHDHHRRLSRHPAHRPPPAAAALLDHAGHPLAGPAAGQAPPSQDGDGAAGAAARARCWSRSTRPACARRCASSRKRASRRSPSASCSPTSMPAHEARALAIVREEYPECFATTSSSVSPQFREFERFTTTAMNAFVGPKVRNYVTRLESEIERLGLQGRPAHHGVQRRRRDAQHGGRAAGAHPAVGPGGRRDRRRLGGRPVRAGATSSPSTSAAPRPISASSPKAASARRRRATPGSRASPCMVPMIDVHTIGAGGGSIAFVDQAGAFKVGPRSAGAVPGPAAYGRGGDARHRDRRQRRAGPPRPRQLPGRRHVARRGGGAARDRRAGARARHVRPRGGRGRDHRDQRQHGQRHPLAHRPEGHRPARLRAGRLRRRRPAARRRGGRHAGHPRGDRAAASRHHLGGRPADQRPALRRHPHLVPGLGRRRPRAHQRRLRGHGQGAGRPLHRRRHRARERHLRAPRRPALCRPGLRAARADPRRADRRRRRWPRPSRPSTRSIAASTAITSPIRRSRS